MTFGVVDSEVDSETISFPFELDMVVGVDGLVLFFEDA